MVDFQKKNWQFRDIISENELNRMEDGIEEGITKAEQAQQTADDARNDIDALTADYEQNAIKTTGDWEMSGELTVPRFELRLAEWTTTQAVNFGDNLYEKVDIEIPKENFFGTIEVTISGSFNASNAAGSITKVIHASLRNNGSMDLNESYYTRVSSLTANHFAISDVIFDPVKDKFVIKIVHRTSFPINTRIIVKGRVGHSSSLNILKQITFSDIYTTDTTQYERPYRTGVIVESGENANGQYVRFADGTQICWKLTSFQNVDGNVFTYNWVTPAQFMGSGRYFGFMRSATASNSIALNRRLAYNQNGYVIDPAGETQSLDLYTLAIGRWK